MAKQRKQETGEIQILAIEQRTISVAIVGTTPLICNRVSEKAKRELLLPGGRKNAAERQQTAKHDVFAEYRASPYTLEQGPTLLAAIAPWFKKGMMTAALDIPGTKRTQIGRLVVVQGERLPLYGTPQIFLREVRSAGMDRTPDIRTRAILPKWATLVSVTFPAKILKEGSVLNLLASAGVFSGAGDWRQEKGAGNYGSYRLAAADDRELVAVMQQGRIEQLEGLNNPVCYDDETSALLDWYVETAGKRELKVETVNQ